MKILIVNQFEKKENFIKFVKYFKKIMKKNYNFQDTNHNLFICYNNQQLRNFIFEYNSPFENYKSGKNFDQLDLIIINGDKGIPPWNNSVKEIFYLVRMCIRSNKPTFISGGSSLNFIFSLSSNLLKKDFITKQIKSPNVNNAFIDISTGDIFTYNWINKKWKTELNCGIHHIIKGNKPNSFQKGCFDIKKSKLEKNTIDPNKFHIKGDPKETICICNKFNIKHYLFNNITSEFKIPFITSYIIHPINFIDKNRKFTILANSSKGPTIFEFNNLISCIFPINLNYTYTKTLLENFINKTIPIIKIGSINFISVFDIKDNNEDKAILDANKAKIIEENKKNNRPIKNTTFYKNSGLALRNKYANDIIINNSIQKNNYQKNLFKNNLNENRYKIKSNLKNNHNNFKKIDLLENEYEFEVDIRKKLHPNFKRNKEIIYDNWYPGYKDIKEKDNSLKKNIINIKNDNKEKYYESKMKYDIKRVDEARSKPIIRCSSAYVTNFQILNKEKLLRNSKIIGTEKIKLIDGTIVNKKKDFIFKKVNDNNKQIFININNKYNPVSDYKFKEVNKNKWMDKKFFLI